MALATCIQPPARCLSSASRILLITQRGELFPVDIDRRHIRRPIASQARRLEEGSLSASGLAGATPTAPLHESLAASAYRQRQDVDETADSLLRRDLAQKFKVIRTKQIQQKRQ
jgi:hypothetical protein